MTTGPAAAAGQQARPGRGTAHGGCKPGSRQHNPEHPQPAGRAAEHGDLPPAHHVDALHQNPPAPAAPNTRRPAALQHPHRHLLERKEVLDALPERAMGRAGRRQRAGLAAPRCLHRLRHATSVKGQGGGGRRELGVNENQEFSYTARTGLRWGLSRKRCCRHQASVASASVAGCRL